MSSRVCVTGLSKAWVCPAVSATGHIKDPVPFIKKSRVSCPGGRFPPSFIHQVIITPGLSELGLCMFSP